MAKCSSTVCIPARNSANRTGPIAHITDRPIAEPTEYRPPTQSQNPNMFAGSIPNSATLVALVDTATKCAATASSPRAATSQRRAAVALVSVSMVVNVFDATTNSVRAGSRPDSCAVRSAGSMLATNRASGPSA